MQANNHTLPKIPRRCSTAILKSMGAGVVPGIGLEYIAVGRKAEIVVFLLGDHCC